MKNYYLYGDRVLLRPLEPALFPRYLSMFSETVMHVLGVPDVESERIYLDVHYRQRIKDMTVFFCIMLQENNQLIGAVEIRQPHYRSQLYNWLNEQFWSQGFMQEALQLSVNYYFEAHPEETQIHALVDCSNIKSSAALERFGFEKSCLRKGSREEQQELIFYSSL